MAFIISESNNKPTTPPIPPDIYNAVCYMICDLGTHYSEFYEKFGAKILIGWEIPELRIEIERDGKMVSMPRIISRRYGKSLGKKADLRRDLENWRGRPFTPEELQSFDLTQVLGTAAQLQVIHREGKSPGSVYANVGTITKLAKGTKMGAPETPIINYSIDELQASQELPDMPQWIKDIITKSEEWKALGGGRELVSDLATELAAAGFKDDDIPF